MSPSSFLSAFFLLFSRLWCLLTHRHCGLLSGFSEKRSCSSPKETPKKKGRDIRYTPILVKVGSTKDQGKDKSLWGFRNNLRTSSGGFHRFSRMDCPELVSVSTVPANKFLCVRIVYPQGDSLDIDSDIPAASAFSVNGGTKGPRLEQSWNPSAGCGQGNDLTVSQDSWRWLCC